MAQLDKANTAGTIVTDHVAVCGRCAKVRGSLGPSARGAIYEAEKEGWRKTKSYGWVCPGCSGHAGD